MLVTAQSSSTVGLATQRTELTSASSVRQASLNWVPDFARVLFKLPLVEWGRLVHGPTRVVATARRVALRTLRRAPSDRRVLRKVIAAVDARLPGGGNCYRRALLEMSLDAGAAQETLFMGLKVHGGPGSGHAWLASWPDAANASAYEAIVAI